MKYGESAFDIAYLLFAIASGIVLLKRARSATQRRMGWATLILGCGDAFHLVPRVLNYFVQGDMTAALGIGKLITSISMTVFYVLLYHIWLGFSREREDRRMTTAVWALAALRIVLCLFPQNGWLDGEGSLLWAILRNMPFALLGAMVCAAYYRARGVEKSLRMVWLYILLSFLFYIPVAVAASLVPMLGMLMLPKTICYVLMIRAFLAFVKK